MASGVFKTLFTHKTQNTEKTPNPKTPKKLGVF
jgi:hypothetical protein